MDEAGKVQISPPQGRPGFAIKIEGPRVGAARLSANDLATIILRSQQALRRIGQVLYGESSIGKGRKKKEIEELCELFLVGWKPGSAVAEVELAEPPAQMSLFGYIGEESLKAFLTGMARIRGQTPDVTQPLPPGFDVGVLQTCEILGRVLEHGIDSVSFEPIRVTDVVHVSFDRPLREKVRNLLGRQIDQQQVEKVGRLEVLDGHHGLRGRLWEPDGTKWLCIFKPEHLEVLPEAWLHTVRLVGEAVVEPGKERTLHVALVLPLEEEMEIGPVKGIEIREPLWLPAPETHEAPQTGEISFAGEAEKPSFWTSLSVEQLAELQGVEPVTDLDSIGALWPADHDPDQMLAYILDDRSSRRRLLQEDPHR